MPRRLESLSADEVRRIAVAAQGFDGRRRQHPNPGMRQIVSTTAGLSGVQIDSVNVVVRAHYMPYFSRLGSYDPSLVDRATHGRPRRLFEYWGHAACLLPVESWPLLQWRMRAYEKRWGDRYAKGAAYIESVFEEVAARGPLAASELSDPGERAGPWWGWGQGKSALEWLFMIGRLAVADRRNFERLYDVPSRVLPAEVLAAPAVPEAEARRELILQSMVALGVATLNDLGEYHYQKPTAVRPIVRDMVASGELVPVSVEGWKDTAYVLPGVKVPRAGSAVVAGVRALVSPFDSLMWDRKRVLRVFDFDYKIEIYVPAPKRVYGYYVYALLLGDVLVARVDLKADRKAGELLVHSAFGEPWAAPPEVVPELADELRLLASWLGLSSIRVGRRGDLARELQLAVRR